MRRNRRLGLVGLTATAVVAAVAAIALAPPSATADVGGPTLVGGNASDPHVIKCKDTSTNTEGYCLYTSQDMGQQYTYPSDCLATSTCANYYPMRDTVVFFSPNGYDNWTWKGVAFTESQLDSWVPRRTDCTGSNPPSNNKPASGDPSFNCRAYHLWAPSVVRFGSSNSYYLYVPDVSNTSLNTTGPNIHNSSRIAVAVSSSGPFGPFVYLGTVPFTSGYMSDPDVVMDGSAIHLIWADGDYSTCGGFKHSQLDGNMISLTGPTTTLQIQGIEVLGSCDPAGPAPPTGKPYVEGASLYKRSFNPTKQWTLIFAAKPELTPPGCQNSNSVIAWASASAPQGPYTYEGIIMCGSTTEWTNQASIAVTSDNRLVIYYHDGVNKQRKVYAECLFTSFGVIAGVYRQPMDAAHGYNACHAPTGDDKEYRGLWAHDPDVPTMPKIVTTLNGGGHLSASRHAVGPWERFKPVKISGTTYSFLSLANGKYVCAQNYSDPIAPTCSSNSSAAARFEMVPDGPRFKLKSINTGRFVTIKQDGKLYASVLPSNQSGAAIFSLLSYMS